MEPVAVFVPASTSGAIAGASSGTMPNQKAST
jgi:hypothetical protein